MDVSPPESAEKTRESNKLAFSRASIQASLVLADKPIITSKFGSYAAALLHMVVSEFPAIPVVWVDTGFNSSKTAEFVGELSGRLRLNLHIFAPRQPWTGPVPDSESSEYVRFVEHTKLDPFSRALVELDPDVWFSAVRREQTHYRGGLPHFQRTAHKLLKVSPLLEWTEGEMADYIYRNGLPFGDSVTDPTKPDAHSECGLHLRSS